MKKTDNTDSFDLAVVGGVFSDTLIPTVEGNEISRIGGISYAAISAARLGAKVTAIGPVVCHDPDLAKRNFETAGVNTSSLDFSHNGIVEFNIYGCEEFDVSHISRTGVPLDTLPWPSQDSLPRSEAFLFYPIDNAWTLNAIKYVKMRGSLVAVDAQHDIGDLEYLRQMIQICDVVFINEGQLMNLTGQETISTAYEVLGKGNAQLCVKRGLCGSTIYDRYGTVTSCGSFLVNYQVTVGAGDVFDAAYCLALLSGKTVEVCLREGACAAGYFVKDGSSDAILTAEIRSGPPPGEEIGLLPTDYDVHQVYIAGHFHGQAMMIFLRRIKKALSNIHIRCVLPPEDIGRIAGPGGIGAGEAYWNDLAAIDDSSVVVAVYDYAIRGGTAFEVCYAIQKKIPVVGLYSEGFKPSNMLTNQVFAVESDVRLIPGSVLAALNSD